MNFNPDLVPGSIIDNNELVSIFKCSTQGGMRKSNTTNSLVLVSNHVDSIYDDRWESDVLHYTGMGQEGDQSLDFMQNKTLAQSNSNGVNVFLFEVFKSAEYTFIGRVNLSSAPYQEIQADNKGLSRHVWIFPIKLANEFFAIDEKVISKSYQSKELKAKRLSDAELEKRAKLNSSRPTSIRNVEVQQYERSVFICELAKRKAKGICQLCKQPAPFNNAKGEPYLETHHIEWLAKGGEDSIQNTVALCPNCHRKMHVLNLFEDRQKLIKSLFQENDLFY